MVPRHQVSMQYELLSMLSTLIHDAKRGVLSSNCDVPTSRKGREKWGTQAKMRRRS